VVGLVDRAGYVTGVPFSALADIGCRSGSTLRRRTIASALWLEVPMTVTSVLAVVIALVILLPAAVWTQRPPRRAA
jgi:hypothetical protein